MAILPRYNFVPVSTKYSPSKCSISVQSTRYFLVPVQSKDVVPGTYPVTITVRYYKPDSGRHPA